MSRARVCFLEGLPTITSIVEGFGGVPSNGSTPLNKLSIGIHANMVLRNRNSTPHVTIF